MIKLINLLPLEYYAFSGLINFITALTISIIVFLFNKKSPTNRIFSVFSLSVAYWSLLYFFWLNVKDKEWAEFYLRSCMVGVLFMPSLFFHFVLLFLKKKVNRKFLIGNYILSILFTLTVYTTLYAKDINRHLVFPYWLHTGPIFHLALAHFGLVVFYSFLLMWQSIKKERGIFRNQIMYVFLGTAIGYISGITNFFCWYRINIPPFLNIFVSVYVILVALAIVRYRLMDINLALTRAGIFLLVYTFVLGIPFWMGFKYDLWKYSTWIMLFLATLGPLIYNYFRRQAEARLRADEVHARELLTQASEGMMRFRSIKKLTSLIVHVTCKTLKLDNAGMFLLDEEKGEYKLEAVRLKSKYQYLGSLDNNDALIQRLSTVDEPLVYEEVKLQSQELNPVRNFVHKNSEVGISNGVKDKTDEPVHDIERQMQALSAAVVIPATSRGRLLGFLVLGEKNSKRMYSQDDLSVLWALSYQAALAIENARFHQKAQEELLREDREVTSRFIGHGASHQFGNLLHRIIQRSEGKEMDLEELDLNSLSLEDLKKLVLQLKDEFSAITKTAFQGKDIVSGILSLGSGSPVEFKEEDLRAIITTAVSTIKLKQSKKTIQDMAQITEIVTHIIDNLPKIYCNSMQLEQVLDNLLDNDLEAIEEKDNLIKRGELKEDNFRGRISIEAGLKNGHIYLKLSDNGIGIKPENQKKVFMPFFTTKATERLSRKGHGIGMHMVKEIIKAHQGKIYIDKTEYTKGTTFVMELPLKVSENKKV